MIEFAGGVQPASPIATPMRKMSSQRKLAARPQNTVINDQMTTQSAMIITRFDRSAHMAIGMPMMA